MVFGDIDLPSFKIFGTIRFERFLPGVIALSLNSGAYLSEIIRSGIQSIDEMCIRDRCCTISPSQECAG